MRAILGFAIAAFNALVVFNFDAPLWAVVATGAITYTALMGPLPEIPG